MSKNKGLTDIINKLYGLEVKKVYKDHKGYIAEGDTFYITKDAKWIVDAVKKYGADNINKKLKEKYKKAPKKKPSKEHVKFVLDMMLSRVKNKTQLKRILTNKDLLRKIKKHGLSDKLTELTLKYPDAISELAKETKGGKKPKKTTKSTKTKTATKSKGKKYGDFIADINGDGTPDLVRVYKRRSSSNNAVQVANVKFGTTTMGTKKRKKKSTGSNTTSSKKTTKRKPTTKNRITNRRNKRSTKTKSLLAKLGI